MTNGTFLTPSSDLSEYLLDGWGAHEMLGVRNLTSARRLELNNEQQAFSARWRTDAEMACVRQGVPLALLSWRAQ